MGAGAGEYSRPIRRVALLNQAGRFVDYIGDGLPGDFERIGRIWHCGRSPRSGIELHMQALVKDGTQFELVSPYGAHSETGESVDFYMRGEPLRNRAGAIIGSQVLTVLRQAAGEGAVRADDFTHTRRVWLWTTARSHLAALELKDPYTALHGVMVGVYAMAFAKVLSPLLISGLNVEIKQDEHGRGYRKIGFTDSDLYELFIAGELHDIGKVHVDSGILNNPGRLNDEQMQEMRGHLLYGSSIIFTGFDTMLARRATEFHHPYAVDLSKGEWPFEGRLMAVADVFDALASKRGYSPDEETGLINALTILLKETKNPVVPGSSVMKMDPVLVGVFRDHFPKINALAMGHLAEEIELRQLELAQVDSRYKQAEKEYASDLWMQSLAELRRIFSASKAALEAQLRLRSDWGTRVAEHFGLSK
ncbi:TPA: hypothetical protein HA316_00925 [Candidatus Micrarchaeota archaeon]|nr:hypothetical protein [Candidatus Micrarchaeota archaeon]